MAPEPTAPASDRPWDQTDPAGAFAAAQMRRVGPFHGAGRRRAPSLSAKARARRAEAASIAEKLVEGGLAPEAVYLAPEGIGDTILPLDGSSFSDWLGRPRRSWLGYPDCAHARKTQAGREYAAFCAEAGIDHVVQIVIRPPDPQIDLNQLSGRHATDSAVLGEMLRYARKSRAANLAWDMIAAEFVNGGRGGWLVDFHFHLTVRGADDDELRAVQQYFTERGWSFWFADAGGEAADQHPVALAQYVAKGLAPAVEDGSEWRADALAELRRQTRCLAMVRACGAFRRWKSHLAKADLTVTEDSDGRLVLVGRRHAPVCPGRRLRFSASVTALRLCVHDFGDGLARRSIRVRGPAGISLTQVQAEYDIDWLLTSSKANAAIPDSSPERWQPGQYRRLTECPEERWSPRKFAGEEADFGVNFRAFRSELRTQSTGRRSGDPPMQG